MGWKTVEPGIRRDHNGWYEIAFTDAGGKRRMERVGSKDLRDARRLRKQRLADVKAGTYRPGMTSRCPTVGEYAEGWLAERRRDGKRSVDDEATRLRLHVMPRFGSLRLDAIKPRDVASWVRDLQRDGQLAPKTIINVHGVFSAMLSRARFDEAIETNPARDLPRGILPTNEKSRKTPPFTRDEAVSLMSDHRIDEDRRTLYAIAALAGQRLGEAAGRRWRDLDREAKPLGMLRVETQYNDQRLKTGRPRQVPVHRVLASVLADWKLRGFVACFGRHPQPDDFIVPDTRKSRNMRSRTKNQVYKALQRDCARIGIPRKGTHSFRRFFISYARMDGARKDVVEKITHNAKGEMIDQYTYLGWETLCEAVNCLTIELPMGKVIRLPVAANGDGRESGQCGAECGAVGQGEQNVNGSALNDSGGAGSRTRVRKRSTVAST